jgi:hypothetical protein
MILRALNDSMFRGPPARQTNRGMAIYCEFTKDLIFSLVNTMNLRFYWYFLRLMLKANVSSCI